MVDCVTNVIQEVAVGSKVSEITSRAWIGDEDVFVQIKGSVSGEGLTAELGAVANQLVIVVVVPPPTKELSSFGILCLNGIGSSEFGSLQSEDFKK